ncbi:MAG: GNAT family N-acetyltransferase [Pseudomonadota bacterium]
MREPTPSQMDRGASFRAYRPSDYDAVAVLWAEINRELAPPHLREAFERYIAVSLEEELAKADKLYDPADGSCLKVVLLKQAIIGTLGVQRVDADKAELRRFYLRSDRRGGAIARKMLEHAEAHAAAVGFRKLVLSTAELQRAAVAFYRKNGYTLTHVAVEEAASAKTVGGGVKRLHFEKALV